MTKSFINIDPGEISKFESLAVHWWDRHGALKALHDINPLRFGYINRRVQLKDKRVLDVGCGGGILAEAMAAEGAHVTGIDMCSASLDVARAHMAQSGHTISYRQITVEKLAEMESQSYDAVICLELLEHVPLPDRIVKACRELVHPGGHVIFATLNRNPKSFLFAIIGAEYLLGLVAKGTHSYRKFVKPGELEKWGRSSGLEFKDLTGMHYNPFTKTYSLGGNAHVNYLMSFKRAGEDRLTERF
jgi:2-polyprenyl-6-hydroxyphenyl methylase/3-demethylubiquinone-9 3-methyltransferase